MVDSQGGRHIKGCATDDELEWFRSEEPAKSVMVPELTGDGAYSLSRETIHKRLEDARFHGATK